MENSKKRKRDGDYPRITYHASDRTFDRLFREDSLAELKEVARRKLGLGPRISISLAQIRNGKTVDLEDDDDFDAFYSLAHSTHSVDVRITAGEEPDEVLPSTPGTPVKKRKRRRNKGVAAEATDQPLPTNEHTTRNDTALNPSPVVPSETRKKKKRKIHSNDIVLDGLVPDRPIESTIVSDNGISGHAREDVAMEPTESEAPVGQGKAKKKRKVKEGVEQLPVGGMLLPINEPKPTRRKKSKSGKPDPQMEEQPPTEITVPISGNPEPTTQEKRNKSKKASIEVNSETTGGPSEAVTTNAQLDTDKASASGAEANHVDVKETISVTSKKLKNEVKELTPAAKAEVDAVFAKVLAAKRAAHPIVVNVAPQGQQEPVLSKSNKKKRKEKPSETVQPDSMISDLEKPPKVVEHAEPCTISATLSKSENPKSASEAEPACPLCSLSPLHDKSKCPLVLGGPESLRSHLVELEEASDEGQIVRLDVIKELRELLCVAEENRDKDAEPRLNGHNSRLSQSNNRGQRVSVSSMNGMLSQSISAGNNRLSSLTKTTMHTLARNATDTSSSETSDDDSSVHDTAFPVVSQNPEYLSNLNLDDLVRGSGISAVQISELHSSPSETSEEEGNDENEENVAFEEEPKVSRRSRKSGVQHSSDDGDSDFDDAQTAAEELGQFASPYASPQHEHPRSSGADTSFQAINRIGESQEVDRTADAAFSAALELDTAILNFTDPSQPITSSEPTPGVDPSVAPSPKPTDLVNTVDITPPILPSTQLPQESSASQPVMSTLLACLRVSPPSCGPHDDAKPPGIIQRMKPRSGIGKAHISNMDIDLPGILPTEPQLSQGSQDVPDVTARRTRACTRRQTLSTMTPPTLPARLGRQTRLIRSSDVSDQLAEGSNALLIPSTSQDAVSLDTWATLKLSSPIPAGDVTMSVDELEPSSPHRIHANMDDNDENPLFIPSESLPNFPYSQWNAVSQIEGTGDSNKEGETSVKRPQRKPRQSENSRYRRLTDISSDHGFFATPTNLRTTRSTTAAKKATDMYGRTGRDEIESESETDSDNSEAEEQSHIPKSRRAGAKQAKRK